ncbi:dihydroxyacetone kinase subunit L [Nocardia flavorosea]|uniref:dihydroxyacetone kinase subunit DhaL n=1 Tax=Nocardia flavorosea TaxID=53429 RepID=UPI001895E6C7|nr:dihydroxyacetone kinase subunit DhaL [Nocardia flavorosea]MBF6351140.1 dihydroxyacetone kinase subunit L [Nocardia flavorosea]
MTDAALPAGFGERWVNTMFAAFLDRTEALADLDRRAGDGDFGANIAAALRRARKNIDAEPAASYTAWLTAVSRGFLGTGGTSGPLFGMFFRELARCTSDSEPSPAEFSRGLSAGVATVQQYGNAEVGHKTMVDALAPAAEALAARVAAGSDPGEALEAAADAAVRGAAGTASLVAKRGRASYVGEVARGVLDPGAAAAALILQTAAAAYADRPGDIDTGWLDTAT